MLNIQPRCHVTSVRVCQIVISAELMAVAMRKIGSVVE